MHHRCRLLVRVIFGSVFAVLLLRVAYSQIDTIVSRIYHPAKSAHLKTNLTSSPFQTSVIGDDDEIYFEQELERLKSSRFIYKAMSFQEKSQIMSSVKIIYWFPDGFLTYSQCPYTNCKIGTDMASSDLVMFNPGMLVKAFRRGDKTVIPTYERPKNQRWCIPSTDPPSSILVKLAELHPELLSSFNLTMSYSLDADAPFIFGRLKRRTEPLTKDYGALFDKKIGMAAWVVSHCKTSSRREEYVQRMEKVKGLDIHIYGSCANMTRKDCTVKGDWRTPDVCLPGLGQEFKFYLSFESSFCPDYVTEKFFKIFYKNIIDMIPVVRGSFDYDRYIPRDTYINAADFKSPEDLASYLIEVGGNKTLYTEMLRKKDRWVFVDSDNVHCKACEVANTHQNSIGYHENFLHSFYGGPKETCRGPTDLNS